MTARWVSSGRLIKLKRRLRSWSRRRSSPSWWIDSNNNGMSSSRLASSTLGTIFGKVTDKTSTTLLREYSKETQPLLFGEAEGLHFSNMHWKNDCGTESRQKGSDGIGGEMWRLDDNSGVSSKMLTSFWIFILSSKSFSSWTNLKEAAFNSSLSFSITFCCSAVCRRSPSDSTWSDDVKFKRRSLSSSCDVWDDFSDVAFVGTTWRLKSRNSRRRLGGFETFRPIDSQSSKSSSEFSSLKLFSNINIFATRPTF